MTKRGIVVLGMARSGTSAVTGSFVAAGCFAGGEHDMWPPDAANPRGGFENYKVRTLNERILAELGTNWLAPRMSSYSSAPGIWPPR